jgi:hypothetical protein
MNKDCIALCILKKGEKSALVLQLALGKLRPGFKIRVWFKIKF